jgi:ankyrin repeat protein
MKIHDAAKFGNTGILSRELDDGVDINTQDADGCTALYYACQQGHIQAVRLLIKKGAISSTRNNDGFHALEIAAAKCHSDITEIILEHGADADLNREGFSALHAAAAVGCIDATKILLKYKATIDMKDSAGTGRTPLHWAIQDGYADIAKLLINSGANVNDKDSEGFTPLLLACSEGYLEIVKLLVKHGAKVNTQTVHEKMTPLHAASAWGNADIAKELLDNYADPTIKDNAGATPLDYAIEYNHKELIELLSK